MIPVVDVNIREKEVEAVIEVVKSRFLAEGKFARVFEEKFSEFTGAKHVVTAVNGTCSLHMAITALDIGPKDEVITTPFTFIASSNVIFFNGAIPIFADINPETYNIDPEKLEEKITNKTKAIMPVHIFGNPCDMKAIQDIAVDYDLKIIEDCAQAHDATIDGKHMGNFGDLGCFSFYGTKNLVSGEGGAVICNDETIYEKLKSIKNHGRNPAGGYSHYRIGYNYRITDMAAAILCVQIDRANEIMSRRHRNGKLYRNLLGEIEDLRTQKILPGHQHSDYIMAPVLLNEKKKPKEVIEYLKSKGVSSRTIYESLSYEQDCYKDLSNWHMSRVINYPDYSKVSCPNSEYTARNHFEIPMVSTLTDEKIQYITQTLKEFFKKA